MTLAKYFILNEFSEIFHGIKNAKDKMLEVNPNLERNMTIHQSIGRTLTLYHKLHDKKKINKETQL